MGYGAEDIEPRFLDAVLHGTAVRFKEYPHAQKYENDDLLQEVNNATDTIVNYGSFGCGTVYKNYGEESVTLSPIPTRVFGIGLHKTATTSLHCAFRKLGYDSLHWGVGQAPLIWQEMEKFGISKTLEQFYALSDLPIPLLYEKLDKAYPGSKFILTVRDSEKWIKSVEGLYSYKTNPTRWTWDAYPITNRLHRALYGRIDFDRHTMLMTYHQHNRGVIKYFKDRPHDLLVMDGKHSWEKLCSFLGEKIPNEPYPTEYVTRGAL
jgi:Sulfotransferase domain